MTRLALGEKAQSLSFYGHFSKHEESSLAATQSVAAREMSQVSEDPVDASTSSIRQDSVETDNLASIAASTESCNLLQSIFSEEMAKHLKFGSTSGGLLTLQTPDSKYRN